MSNPETPLAVITVTYSPGKHLPALVESLAAATAFPTRLICADNGSTDGVPQDVASANGSVEFLPTGGNIGYGPAINFAARSLIDDKNAGRINPTYFLIVNPDVEFLPSSIDALLECARTHPEAGAVGPRIQEADGSAYPSAREVPTLVTGIGHAVLYPFWPSNPFSRAYKAGEDMDTLRRAGWLSGFCPDALITHDQGHAAKKYSAVTTPAHHDSAYRFQADRHPHWWEAPLRLVLWSGLKARALLARAVG